MDMGEALDTNKEMVTVGTSNLLSGLLFGFTGKIVTISNVLTIETLIFIHLLTISTWQDHTSSLKQFLPTELVVIHVGLLFSL